MKKWSIMLMDGNKPGMIYEVGFETKAEAIETIRRWKREDVEECGRAPGELVYRLIDNTNY